MPNRIYASDLHLEHHAYAKHPSMWGDSYFALEQIVDYKLQFDAELYLAGDILEETRPDSLTVKKLLLELRRQDAVDDYPTYFICGNHDPAVRDCPWLSVVSGLSIRHLHRNTSLRGPGIVYGLDWQPADKLAAAMAAIPQRASILLCHQVWEEFMGDRGVEGAMRDLVPPHISLVVTGDFHRHIVLEPCQTAGRHFKVLSPGSTSLQSVSEDPQKYVFLQTESGEIRSLPLRGRKVLYSSIVSEDLAVNMIEELVEETKRLEQPGIPEHLQSPMWVIQYSRAIPGILDSLQKAALGRAHLFPKPFATESEAQAKPIVTSRKLAEALAECVEVGSAKYNTALRLLETPAEQVKDEIGKLVAELTGETK